MSEDPAFEAHSYSASVREPLHDRTSLVQHVLPMTTSDFTAMRDLEAALIHRVVVYGGGCPGGKVAFLQGIFNSREARTLEQLKQLIGRQVRLHQMTEAGGDALLVHLGLMDPPGPKRFHVTVEVDALDETSAVDEVVNLDGEGSTFLAVIAVAEVHTR